MRDAFSARLNEALNDVPNVRKDRGRNVDFRERLAEAGLSKTAQATNKWLRGEAMAEKDNIRFLARWLGVREEWLEYGVGPKHAPDYDAIFERVDEATGVRPLDANEIRAKNAAEKRPDATSVVDIKQAAAAKVLEMLSKHKGLNAEARNQIVQVVEQTVTEVQQSNVITADFSRSARVRDGELLIPQYDVRGSMGHGQLPADYTEFVRNVVVTEKQLEKLTLKYTEATNLAIITGWGQSMAPTIQDQDPVVVDRGITSYQDDGIYVITWQGHLFIKRVHLASGDKLKIISDCRPHDSDTVDPEDIYVHGKVLYIWNGKKA